MAYELVQNSATQYAVDWPILARFVRSHEMAKHRARLASVKTVSQTTWNPFSWSLPEISSVEVPWDDVTARASVATFLRVNELRNVGDTQMRYVAIKVRDMIRETDRLNTRFLELMASTQSENMTRVNKSVASYDSKIEIAKFLRDTSADGLMVGATVLTGGAATAVLAGGSALKGYGRYEDTDNVVSGVMTGVGSFAFGAFQIGGLQKGAIVIMQASWETGTCLVEGKGFAESVATGSLKLAGLGVDKVFKLGVVQSLLGKAAVPMAITLAGSDVTKKVVEGMAKKIVQKQVAERGGKMAIKAMKAGFGDTPNVERPSVLHDATYADELMLDFAVVNMDKGIGQGW